MSIIIKVIDNKDDDHHHCDQLLGRLLAMSDSHLSAPTRLVEVEGNKFAYRRRERFLQHAIQFLEE